MANKSFNQRHPSFKWVILLATTLTLVLTVISVKYVSTNSKQEASTGWYSFECNSDPSWSSLLGHTDYATGVKYHYKLRNNCDGLQYFYLSASRPSEGWSYDYNVSGVNCSKNVTCRVSIMGKSTIGVYVTIRRPVSASAGTRDIHLRAKGQYNTSLSATKTVPYTVIPVK